MTEREITRAVLQTVKSRQLPSCALEIKFTRTGSIPFKAVVEHQRQGLLHAKTGSVVFKIPDLGLQNPFDAFVLRNTEAWVVAVYYEPRRPKIAVFVDIEAWITEESWSERKSLTLERAQAIGKLYELV